MLSTFDVANLFRGRISGKQLFKNVSKTAATVAAGTGGWMAGASAGAAIGSIIPGVGTAIGGIAGGLIGSFAGGSAAGKVSSAVLDEMIEDDAVKMQGILEQEFKQLAEDYLINQKEAEKICDRLSGIVDGDFLKKMFASESRHSFANKSMLPLFEDIAQKRKKITLPSDEQMVSGLKSVLNDVVDYQEEEIVEENIVTGRKEETKMTTEHEKELELQHNFYTQKVIFTKSPGGINTVLKAVAEFLSKELGDEVEYLTNIENVFNCRILKIEVEEISNDAFLVKCDIGQYASKETYCRDMFFFLEDYMEKIDSNKCPVCGEEIVGKGKFCANCGTTL